MRYKLHEKAYEKIQKIDELNRKKEQLKKAIDEIDEKEALAQAKCSTYMRDKILLHRLPVGWLDSVYCTCREELIPQISCTLGIPDLERAVRYRTFFFKERRVYYQYFALLCEAVLPASEGIVLVLRDPFRTVFSQPIKNLSAKMAMSWIGRILIVKAEIFEDQCNRDVLEICSIKRTKLTKKGIINASGKEEKLFSMPAQAFIGRRKVLTKLDCEIELENIKRRAVENGWWAYKCRFGDYALYLAKGTCLCGIVYRGGIFEVVWDTEKKFDDYEKRLMDALTDGQELELRPTENLQKFDMIGSYERFCANPTKEDV